MGCQLRELENAGTCKAACENSRMQTACASNDDCCPGACHNNNDSDCDPRCGNGVVERDENCEPVAECTRRQTACRSDQDTVREGPRQRSSVHLRVRRVPPTAAATADGQCPSGCSNDPDCKRATGVGLQQRLPVPLEPLHRWCLLHPELQRLPALRGAFRKLSEQHGAPPRLVSGPGERPGRLHERSVQLHLQLWQGALWQRLRGLLPGQRLPPRSERAGPLHERPPLRADLPSRHHQVPRHLPADPGVGSLRRLDWHDPHGPSLVRRPTRRSVHDVRARFRGHRERGL